MNTSTIDVLIVVIISDVCDCARNLTQHGNSYQFETVKPSNNRNSLNFCLTGCGPVSAVRGRFTPISLSSPPLPHNASTLHCYGFHTP